MTDLEKYKLEDICYRAKRGQYLTPAEQEWIVKMHEKHPDEYKIIQERAAKRAMAEMNPF